MQTSAPLTAKDAKKIALRRGLFFGISASCLWLLITALMLFFAHLYLYGSSFFTEISYLIVLLAFLAAGATTARKTKRVDMGARAGFWAGAAVALFLLIGTLLLIYRYSVGASGTKILLAVLEVIPRSLLALIIGLAVGALGGLIGHKSDASSALTPPPFAQPASAPATPAQSFQATTQPASTAPAQPTQPSQSPPQQQA